MFIKHKWLQAHSKDLSRGLGYGRLVIIVGLAVWDTISGSTTKTSTIIVLPSLFSNWGGVEKCGYNRQKTYKCKNK